MTDSDGQDVKKHLWGIQKRMLAVMLVQQAAA